MNFEQVVNIARSVALMDTHVYRATCVPLARVNYLFEEVNYFKVSKIFRTQEEAQEKVLFWKNEILEPSQRYNKLDNLKLMREFANSWVEKFEVGTLEYNIVCLIVSQNSMIETVRIPKVQSVLLKDATFVEIASIQEQCAEKIKQLV